MTADELAGLRAIVRGGFAADLREALGLSQAEMAQAVGVNQSTLSRWEGNKAVPKGRRAESYFQVLGRLVEMARRYHGLGPI